jgi:hypothetical protein
MLIEGERKDENSINYRDYWTGWSLSVRILIGKKL